MGNATKVSQSFFFGPETFQTEPGTLRNTLPTLGVTPHKGNWILLRKYLKNKGTHTHICSILFWKKYQKKCQLLSTCKKKSLNCIHLGCVFFLVFLHPPKKLGIPNRSFIQPGIQAAHHAPGGIEGWRVFWTPLKKLTKVTWKTHSANG